MTMAAIRAMVVEDNPAARARLIALLSQDPDVDVVAGCGDGREAISTMSALAPDVLFVDVDLPETDGFALLEQVGGPEPPIVVFVTASDAHAVRAFDARVFDYVLKPFGRERLTAVLRRLKREIDDRATAEQVTRMAATLGRTDEAPSRLAVRVDGVLRVIPTADVVMATGASNYTIIQTNAGQVIVRQTMAALETQLGGRFLRVHRSRIINVDRVYALEPVPGGGCEIELTTGDRVRVPRAQRAELYRRLIGAPVRTVG